MDKVQMYKEKDLPFVIHLPLLYIFCKLFFNQQYATKIDCWPMGFTSVKVIKYICKQNQAKKNKTIYGSYARTKYLT